jgi:hypothetical protein
MRKGVRKTTNNLRIAGVPTEIGTEHLPSASVARTATSASSMVSLTSW